MDKLSKNDLKAIRAVVRDEMRRASFSKAWSLVKMLLLLGAAIVAVSGMAVALDKLMNKADEESEEYEEE